MKINTVIKLVVFAVFFWSVNIYPGLADPGSKDKDLTEEKRIRIIEEEWDKAFGPEPVSPPIRRPKIIAPRRVKKASPAPKTGEPLGVSISEKKEEKITPVLIEKKVPVKETVIISEPEITKETRQIKEDVLARPPSILPEPSALKKKVNLVCAGSPLGIVLSELASEAGFKVICDSGVNRQAPVVEKLEFVPINEAIQAILRPLGYDWRYSGKTINIISIETRAYRVDLPVIKSSFDNSITNMPASGEEAISSRAGAKVSLRTVNPEMSIWKDIKENIKNMVSKEGSCTISEATGIVTVKDIPKNLDTIGEYLAIINKECQKQVLVECKIVEVRFLLSC